MQGLIHRAKSSSPSWLSYLYADINQHNSEDANKNGHTGQQGWYEQRYEGFREDRVLLKATLRHIPLQQIPFFDVTCYQACMWDHSGSTLQMQLPYLLHSLLSDIM